MPDAEKVLKPGDNKVRVEISGKNAFPYTLRWNYSTLQPPSAEHCPVQLTTKLAAKTVKESDSVRLTVQVENRSGKGQGMAVAIVGLPGGLTVPEDLKQLKEYTRQPVDGGRPRVSAFEIRGRELILYWRDLGPRSKDRGAGGPDRPRPRRIQRPRQPCVSVLQRRRETLGCAAGRDHHGR